MDDKNEQIYSQYKLDIDNVYKNKGIVYLETKEGLYTVKPYSYTEKKIKLENEIKLFLAGKGYLNTDLCIENNQGEYISLNRYANKYIVKEWFYGRECDINSIEDMCRASGNLANLHSLLKEVNVDGEGVSRLEAKNLVKEYMTHINELRRVKKYIANKKKKNSLELEILKTLDYYYKQANEYVEKLQKSDYLRLYEEALIHKKLCHGNYTYHSILLGEDEVFTYNFDKVNIGVQIYDLYTLIRKAMEKNNWDIDMAKMMIKTYNECLPLNNSEKNILIILFGYPDKYRKLINGYYNGKKSWLSIRIYEKLNELIRTEEIRKNFIKDLDEWLREELV